jgi:hypothetical protein
MIQAFDDQDPMPPYASDSRKMDTWLKNFVKTEPHLAGVLNSVATIDKNRGWSVTGGRNQVNRVTDMLHNFESAPGLTGWRPAFGFASKSFWSSNIGAIIELGTDGVNGPVRKLYNVDPTRCVLTGDSEYPLRYYPPKGQKLQKWKNNDFFRVISVSDLDETFNGLSDCAVYRAVGIAQLMVALMRHDAEQLLARAPRGLLLLQGIRQSQWNSAMAAQDSELDANEVRYFGALAVLASASEKVDAKMVALSQLPAAFNLKDWMDWTMYGYALCFGYDASEFWPVQYGALGRGNETQIQHEKATAKGRLDFVLGFQEQIQNVLPDSVDYAVEQRDDQGDLLRASVLQAWSTVAKTLYEAKDLSGLPLVTNEEARVLLAQFGVIPSSWSPTAEVASTDSDDVENDPTVDPLEGPESQPQLPAQNQNPVAGAPTAQQLNFPKFNRIQQNIIREKLLESPRIWRAAERFPKDPIVRYEFGPNAPRGRIITLWRSGEELIRPTPQLRVTQKFEEQEEVQEINMDKTLVTSGIPRNIRIYLPQKRVIDPETGEESEQENTGSIIFSPIINIPAPEVIVYNDIYMPEPRKETETVTVTRDANGKISQVTKSVKE